MSDLVAWSEEYEAIFDEAYPPESAFPTPEAELAWENRGRDLARRGRR